MKQYEQEIYELAAKASTFQVQSRLAISCLANSRLWKSLRKQKTGQYVTSEEVMVSLENKHPIVHKILEYRGIKKTLNKQVKKSFFTTNYNFITYFSLLFLLIVAVKLTFNTLASLNTCLRSIIVPISAWRSALMLTLSSLRCSGGKAAES